MLTLTGVPAYAAGSGGTESTQAPGTSISPAGGASPDQPVNADPSHPTVPGTVAKFRHGVAYAPAAAPRAVQEAIWAGNKLRHQPYVYGGGHQSFRSHGYDCSGTISYVLHAGDLLSEPLDSGSFMDWGKRGKGQWITIYANGGHAFVIIAGLRLDTSQAGDNYNQGEGPRWRSTLRDTHGFRAVHPTGY